MKIFANMGKKLSFTIFLVLLTLSAAHAQTFTGPGFTIVDNVGPNAASCSIIPVSGITTSRNVRRITLTSMTHTFIGDVVIRVYPPGTAAPPSTLGSIVISSPPDDRACNFNGTYNFEDTAAQSIDQATAGPCTTATNVAPGNYRTSTYIGPTGVGPTTSMTTTFGLRTPAQINGNWRVCVFDFAAGDSGSVASASINFAVPTAASVSIGGRVATQDGTGIGKTVVTLTEASGTSHTVITNPFGYYRFEGLAAGENYVISAMNKRYSFETPTVVYFASEDTEGVNFTANP